MATRLVGVNDILAGPIPPPAILKRIGLRFRKVVVEFVRRNDVRVIRFAKGQRKLEVMRPHLDRLIQAGVTGVAAIGGGSEIPVTQTTGQRGGWVYG